MAAGGTGYGVMQPGAPDVSGPMYPKLLTMLDPVDRAFLLAAATERRVGKDQLIYHQGDRPDHAFVIREGAIKILYIHENGSALTTSYYREGMLVGAHGCSGWSDSHSWSAQALTDCRLLYIRRADYLDLMERSPQALRCALAIAEFKNELLKRVIRILAEPTLEGRITRAIRHLALLYGIDRGGETEIEGHFTHQEIADMVGASRQSVTTMLVALERTGVIRRSGRRLFVPSDRAGRGSASCPASFRSGLPGPVDQRDRVRHVS